MTTANINANLMRAKQKVRERAHLQSEQARRHIIKCEYFKQLANSSKMAPEVEDNEA